MDRQTTCFFTGHRNIPRSDYDHIQQSLLQLITELCEKGVTDFICGGAIGFDTMAAVAVEKARKEKDIRLHLVLPCKDQHKYFSPEQKNEYMRILSIADSAEFLYESYCRGCMHARNKKMAERSAHCITYCRSDSGGTASTLRLAKKLGINILEI